MNEMKTTRHVAIVGGGPGGLTLARLLVMHGIDVAVFERDTHSLERPQGGTLDLHEDSGIAALERAGLQPAFREIARYEDQGTRMLDKTGHVLFEQADAAAGNRPEVDRTALREILLASLPAETVRWGSAVRDVSAASAGRWCVTTDSGIEGPFDLVVGADGAWSRVRPLLSPYKPQYSGLVFIEFGIDDIDAQHPALSRMVGRGKMSVEADGKCIIAQRNGHAHVRVYAIFRVPVDWAAKRFDFAAPAAVREALIREFDGFDDAILDLFRAGNDAFAVRPIHALPVGHCWEHKQGLTLLGDAAHVMSPFGGDGVNNAMFDAAELARWLVASDHWTDAVQTYETQMFARIVESAEGAAEGAATFLSHDGAALTLALYRSHEAEVTSASASA